MKYSMYDDLGNITVLTKNSIKCLGCNTILESKHRHQSIFRIDGGICCE